YVRLFDVVAPVIEAFAALCQSHHRAEFASNLSADALGILRTFAHAASVLAVRGGAPQLLLQGLIAIAILGVRDDIRDLTFYLATLYHSAVKIGVDAAQLFSQVAPLSPSESLQSTMREFPFRSPSTREIRAFGLRETVTRQGFD